MYKQLRDHILWEDEQLLVVNKPAGLLSAPDRFDPYIPHLRQVLSPKYGELWTVHRLDRDTSGVIVLARTAAAHRALSMQFTAHQTQKVYRTIVEGQLRNSSGTIAYGLAEDARKPGKMVVSNKGQEAVTHYRVLTQFEHFAELEVVIETGRTHQIRVHLQAIGHPILADATYGLRDSFLLSTIKGRRKFHTAKHEEERPLLRRMALHAERLTIAHPTKDENLEFVAPLPKDLRAVLYQLNKLDRRG
ncbi:MAG: RluA family pseudouridine synthase [Bacteroidetes bacterium]|nr:MAG: RluA family pseudouridine synthase [Bacteroidota bacterium]